MPRQWHYRSPAENLACTSCLLRSAEDNLMTQMHESWGGRLAGLVLAMLTCRIVYL